MNKVVVAYLAQTFRSLSIVYSFFEKARTKLLTPPLELFSSDIKNFAAVI